jgi:hypothetical protein
LIVVAGTQIAPQDLSVDLATPGVGYLGGTIMRTHLRISCSSLLTDGSPGAFYGIVVWDKQVASATSPNVATDFNVDWMIQRLITPGTANQVVTSSTSYLYGDTIDIKSRRRVHEVNDHPFFYFANTGTANMNLSFFAKQLYARP